MRRFRQESMAEKAYRYRGVIFVVSVPLLLMSFVLIMMPRSAIDNFDLSNGAGNNGRSNLKYAVVFDAGSSGSRVHVYCFNHALDLLPIGDEMELFRQKKPGLSTFASNPKGGAESLKSLLEEAIEVIPEDLRESTPVRLGATAGLRTLPGESADQLLEEVKDLLEQSPLQFSRSRVSILDGSEEGAFEWVTLNYLLGNLGKGYSETVGIVDLGGGSVQMAYAISEKEAENAPKPIEGEDSYIKIFTLLGETYHLYVHSYLRFGLLAARAEIFKLVKDGESCPCVSKPVEYTYGSGKYNVVASSGANDVECRKLVLEALNKDQACTHLQCTFGGVWNGGHGDGLKKLLVASFFFDRAVEAGIIKDPEATQATVKPSDFQKAAKTICYLSYDDIGDQFPSVEEELRPYICMDLIYQYTLLVDGFDIGDDQEITLVKKVKYRKSYVEAAWALGSAVELVS